MTDLDKSPVAEFFLDLGPGLITGAADDDPSGISTYSVAGASLGLAPLWTALFSFPLMTAVQLMCARLGMVTGRGLAANIRAHFPRWVTWMACLILLVANVFNIGADIGGMSDAMEMVTHVPAVFWSPMFALTLVVLVIFASYRIVAKVFKWLTLVLFAYVITAFLTHPDWSHVLRATLIPEFHWSRDFFAVMTGLLGTTISPYLFFWQASQEVEEERALGRNIRDRKGATDKEISVSLRDTLTGMFLSNMVMFFIILTTATTLHAHGMKDIQTAKQAAEALRPLAGNGAYLLFTLGIIGTGMLAVPVLAGSSAYAVAEAARWGASLNRPLRLAPRFYAVLAAAVGLGMLFDFAGFNSVRMLFLSAVLNGILAPPLIVLVLLLTSSEKVMGERKNGFALKTLGWLCAGLMTISAVGVFAA